MVMRLGMSAVAAAAAFAFAGFVTSSSAVAAVQTKEVKYAVGDKEYVGFYAWDDATKDKRPGVLVAPEWTGLNGYAKGRAKQLAELGYAALAVDPYGGGKTAADVKQSAEWSTALKNDRPELRARVGAALAALTKQDEVDAKKTAAIGYCFGGTTVLELAREGADVKGVVSFHGGLSAPLPAKAGDVKAKVLICHGEEDPFVKPAEVEAFKKEMKAAKVAVRMETYAGAVHSFTNPEAKGDLPGAKYNEAADKRSWATMKTFLAELFK